MIAFLAALPAFIQSLPAMFQLAVKFMALAEKIIAWAERNNLHSWFGEVEGAIDALENAKDPISKQKAARGLSDIVRKLG